MAFHDDVDDANDANDKTSSEHEFELPFPRRAASSTPAANSANDGDESALVDLSEASNDGVYNLDAELGVPAIPEAATPTDLPQPPPSASTFAPIDVNDEFPRSDLAEGLDHEERPWAMAPAPDPTQAVPQLDAPDGLSDEQRSAAFESDDAAAANDDPDQIPVDDPAQQVDEFADSAEPEDASDFNFDSLFATEDPAVSAEASAPAGDTSWAEVSPAADSPNTAPAEESPATNNIWKLGPLEPNAAAEDTASPDEETTTEDEAVSSVDEMTSAGETGDDIDPASTELPLAVEEVIEGPRIWNLDGVDAPVAVEQTAAAESADEPEIPTPPVRRSMADDELLNWVDSPENQSTGTLSVIQVLEAQLRLREEEAREYREWETTLHSKVAPGDEEVVEPAPTERIIPESSAAAAAAPAPPAAQLPAWDVPPPSDTWAPSDDFDDEIPFAAHADPTGSITLPVLHEETLNEVLVEDESVTNAISAGAPSSESETGDADSAPTASQFEQSPEFPADEDGDYDEIPFTPPPLVEPITAPSTPRSNLDEQVSFGDFGFTPPISGEPEAGAEPTTDATAAAPASDADNESPFAFDLDSSSASGTATEPDLQTSGTNAADDDIDTHAAVVEDSTAAPEADSDAAPAAFSFASQETPRYVPTAPLNFDDLLKTDDLDDSDEEPESDETNPLDAFISELDTELVPQADPLSADLATPHAEDDSNTIPFAAAAASASVAGAVSSAAMPAPAAAAASAAGTAPLATDASAVPQPMPLSAARVSQQPLGLDYVAPTAQRVFSLEESGLEPTPVDRRIGHAARMFWLWFAANSSIVSIGLGAAVFAVGMSLRQSVVAILAGVALSFIPLGLTTLAGKRSGQPTMVISRSAFGLLGNIVPSLVALVGRLFWGAVLLWILASSVAIVLIGSDLNVGLGDRQLLLIALALSFLVALVIAFAGYPLFARIQLILSIISGVLVVGLIAFTAQYVDVSQALTVPDGSWLLTLTGAVLVFSFLGLVWAYSGADIARYQRVSSSGPASALSASFGATLPAFVLIAYGALLASSDPALARGFLASPLDTLLLLLPGWYPIPLLLAAALSLLSGITLSLYSGGFALQAIGVRLPRQWSIVIVGVLLGALSVLFAFGVNGGVNELFRDVATTLAVPTAAWVGIFAAETMIRTRRLDSAALTTRGGIYADVRWVNLSAFILISAIGFALTSATIGWLSWQGYGFEALGIDLSSELAASDLGVLVALVLGMLTPIVAGIPAIKRQEAGSSERAVRPA